MLNKNSVIEYGLKRNMLLSLFTKRYLNEKVLVTLFLIASSWGKQLLHAKPKENSQMSYWEKGANCKRTYSEGGGNLS